MLVRFAAVDANMDILDKQDEINFRDSAWRIYSRNQLTGTLYQQRGDS